ncbi:hypothetical protein [Paludisphaera mucosa]|uniref:Lipoprotein n=1 Tax=Paludisphaera mucosa TaxID=3030827 RepID=A0ABT6FHJ1_9BACT|nr:hypothetical protein [Paludisphaera mucosa]MDG3007010.1 hypothetical protein [Paludisphaera mucosa]
MCFPPRVSIAAAILALLALGVSGCYTPPGESLERTYKTPLPKGVTVLHYYSDSYKDPQFLWVLSPAEKPFLDALIANAGLKPAAKGVEFGRIAAPGPFSWWDQEAIEKLPELYYRDPDPNDGSYYRIWVDRKANRLYILFMNT